jgi:hypothetical protein
VIRQDDGERESRRDLRREFRSKPIGCADIYRAGNGGTCGVVLGESGARAACGSRFGCAFCCVAGERDESPESMIEEEQYAHLKPLNDFRNHLLAVQWDLAARAGWSYVE